MIDKELGDRYEDDSGDETHNQAGDCPVEQPPHSNRQDPECYWELHAVHVVQFLKIFGCYISASLILKLMPEHISSVHCTVYTIYCVVLFENEEVLAGSQLGRS